MHIIFTYMKRCLICKAHPKDCLFSSTQFCTATPENEWVSKTISPKWGPEIVFPAVKKIFLVGAENKKAPYWKEQPFFFKPMQNEFDQSTVWMNYDRRHAVTVLHWKRHDSHQCSMRDFRLERYSTVYAIKRIIHHKIQNCFRYLDQKWITILTVSSVHR